MGAAPDASDAPLPGSVRWRLGAELDRTWRSAADLAARSGRLPRGWYKRELDEEVVHRRAQSMPELGAAGTVTNTLYRRGERWGALYERDGLL